MTMTPVTVSVPFPAGVSAAVDLAGARVIGVVLALADFPLAEVSFEVAADQDGSPTDFRALKFAPTNEGFKSPVLPVGASYVQLPEALRDLPDHIRIRLANVGVTASVVLLTEAAA
jgi:hypothetical protein